MRFARQSLRIAAKDLRAEMRTKEALNAALAFGVVILVIFSFVLDPGSEAIREMSGGLLWLTFVFAGALILNRAFARELPNDCLDTLLAAPLSGAALFLGKTLASFVLLIIVEGICLPIFGVLYDINWLLQPGLLAAVLLLATWGISVIGTVFSALTVNLRLRELMLPMLVYPIMIPALMAAMRLTTLLVTNEPISNDDWIWFRLLIGFDIIFTSLALGLVEIVLIG